LGDRRGGGHRARNSLSLILVSRKLVRQFVVRSQRGSRPAHGLATWDERPKRRYEARPGLWIRLAGLGPRL